MGRADIMANIDSFYPFAAKTIKPDVRAQHAAVTDLMKDLYGAGFDTNKVNSGYNQSKHHADDEAVFIRYTNMYAVYQQLPLKRPTGLVIDDPLKEQKTERLAIMAELAAINKDFKNKKIKEDKLKDAKDRR